MKPDDSSLEIEQLNNVRIYASNLLKKSDALGHFPTPVDQIVESANLYINDNISLEHNQSIVHRYTEKIKKSARPLIAGIKKTLGLIHIPSNEIILDQSLPENKKKFLKLHETGHGYLPHQREMFEIIEDGEMEISPDIEDLFEKEANNFAAEILFQIDSYEKVAADYLVSIRTPMELAKIFGSSIYASMRRYVQTHYSPIALAIYNKFSEADKSYYQLRRAPQYSNSFIKKFGLYNFPLKSTTNDDLGGILNKSRLQTNNNIVIQNLKNEYYLSNLQIFNNSYQIFVLLIPQSKISSRKAEALPPILVA